MFSAEEGIAILTALSSSKGLSAFGEGELRVDVEEEEAVAYCAGIAGTGEVAVPGKRWRAFGEVELLPSMTAFATPRVNCWTSTRPAETGVTICT